MSWYRGLFWRRAKYDRITIAKTRNGSIMILIDNHPRYIDLKSKTPDEKMEAIKQAVLAEGFVWTEELERHAEEIVFV